MNVELVQWHFLVDFWVSMRSSLKYDERSEGPGNYVIIFLSGIEVTNVKFNCDFFGLRK